MPVTLPPLRQRRDDVPLLLHFYMELFNQEFRKHIRRITPKAADALKAYAWPGNVRELRNAVERAMLLTDEDELSDEHFPVTGMPLARLSGPVELPVEGVNLDELERSLVVQALERSGWNQTRAAALLGLNRDQIRYRVEKFKLEKPTAQPGQTSRPLE
jgi:DNA-binding NtrC family response regulator